MTLYLYRTNPIDFWFGWMPLREVLIEAIETADDELDEIDGRPTLEQMVERLRQAKVMARQLSWEGDMREGPYFAPIPFETGGYEYIIAWKQDNNGTTFVASPERLPWLEPEAEWIDDHGGKKSTRLSVFHNA